MPEQVCLHINIITQDFPIKMTIVHSHVLYFLYKATFTILSRSDIDSFRVLIDSFERVMYLPNAVQPTLCYSMFFRFVSKRLVHIYMADTYTVGNNINDSKRNVRHPDGNYTLFFVVSIHTAYSERPKDSNGPAGHVLDGP